MTADIELLPPPKWLLEGFTDPTIERLCDYTRANVAHATEPLKAEIERLRAEVEQLAEALDIIRALPRPTGFHDALLRDQEEG